MPPLLTTLLTWLTLTTLALSQPAGTLNSPNWATGYIWAQPGTTVSTTITNRQPLPNDINVFAAGPITTWNITFPNPPFDGEIISIGCPSTTVGTITLSSTNGSTVAPAGATSCSSIGTILTYQFNYYANTWYNISASYASSSPPTPQGNLAFTPPTVVNLTDPQWAGGAKCDGTTNDYAAWQAAYTYAAANAPATIVFPERSCNFGSSTAQVNASNITIEGTGATLLTTAAVGLQIGDSTHAPFNDTINGLTVAGNTGGLPSTTSIGIYWAEFAYGEENYTTVHDFGILREADDIGSRSQVSIGLNINFPRGYNASETMFEFNGVAQAHVLQPQFGKNGGDAWTSPCMVTITGVANGNEISGGDIVPERPDSSTATTVYCYIGAINPSNTFVVNNVDSENYKNVVSSDSTVDGSGYNYISQLVFTAGRLGGTNEFFNLNAATKLAAFALNGVDIGGSVTIPQSAAVSFTTISGSFIGGTLSVAGGCPLGGGTLTNQSGFYNCVGGTDLASSFTVTGGELNNLSLSGTFQNVASSPLIRGTYSDTSTCNYNSYCKQLYANGLFTPSLLVAGASCTQPTLSGAGGVWQIDGNSFTVDVILSVANAGTCTGLVSLAGLPFTIKNNFGAGFVTSYSGFLGIYGPLVFSPLGGTQTVLLQQGGATTVAPLTMTNMPNGAGLIATVKGAIQ